VAIFLDAELTVARTKKKKKTPWLFSARFGNAFVRWWIGAMRKMALLRVQTVLKREDEDASASLFQLVLEHKGINSDLSTKREDEDASASLFQPVLEHKGINSDLSTKREDEDASASLFQPVLEHKGINSDLSTKREDEDASASLFQPVLEHKGINSDLSLVFPFMRKRLKVTCIFL
jgi:uncharacterized protein (UPF0371 family)